MQPVLFPFYQFAFDFASAFSPQLNSCRVLKANDLFIIGNAFPVCFQHYITFPINKRVDSEF